MLKQFIIFSKITSVTAPEVAQKYQTEFFAMSAINPSSPRSVRAVLTIY